VLDPRAEWWPSRFRLRSRRRSRETKKQKMLKKPREDAVIARIEAGRCLHRPLGGPENRRRLTAFFPEAQAGLQPFLEPRLTRNTSCPIRVMHPADPGRIVTVHGFNRPPTGVRDGTAMHRVVGVHDNFVIRAGPDSTIAACDDVVAIRPTVRRWRTDDGEVRRR